MAYRQQCILAREEGMDRCSYLGVTFSNQRKADSWWVSLSLHRRDATVWTVEAFPECLHHVTISTDMGGSKRVYLTPIGDSKEGAETCLEEDAFAVMVDKVDKIEARWVQHAADTEKGGKIFRIAQGPRTGCALTGLCFPDIDLLNGQRAQWRPVTGPNSVIVKPTCTKPEVDGHVVWTMIQVKRSQEEATSK